MPLTGNALAADSYHDCDAVTAALQQVAADHPAITRLTSAGPSVEGRELWWAKITDNPALIAPGGGEYHLHDRTGGITGT
jgi:hypothetical protein